MKILFIGKKSDQKTVEASEHVKQTFPDSQIVFGEKGIPFPEELKHWKGDYVFSYLSPWIIPSIVLENAAKGAINWHPGPPEYPGIGCTNFAIYNREKEFGITCHYMAKKVDTGQIIEVKRFEVKEEETVLSMTKICYELISSSFFEIIEKIKNGETLPVSKEEWQRKPYTRKELDALCKIESTMDKAEIELRIKATTYNRPWAYTEIEGIRFYWNSEN